MPAVQPRDARLYQEAMDHYRAGDPEGAIARCREILKRSPRLSQAHWLMAMSMLANGQIDAAQEAAIRGLKLAPDEPDLLQALATAHTRQGRFDEALATIERAVAARPDEPAPVATLADVHFRLGEFDRAAEVLDALIARGGRHISLALSFAQVCPRLGRQREGIALLESSLRERERPSPQTISAMFSLGDLYDNIGEYDLAFAAYERANQTKGERPEAEEYFASLDRMIAAWTPSVARSLPKAADRSEVPVFIVGMPRSGTSLSEQILASHPDVFGAGEREDIKRLVRQLQAGLPGTGFHLCNPEVVSPRAVERMARTALRDLRALSPRAARITDKNPVNTLHLGLISLIFPGAKVLYCRRDPLDTALSCYFHNLVGVDMMAGSLALMGRWVRAYQRTMDHWRSVLDAPIHDVVYEDVVNDQEAATRQTVAFLGLPWTDDVLNFHQTRRPTLTPSVDQVRRPMYKTSVERWRNYEQHLGPLREALGV